MHLKIDKVINDGGIKAENADGTRSAGFRLSLEGGLLSLPTQPALNPRSPGNLPRYIHLADQGPKAYFSLWIDWITTPQLTCHSIHRIIDIHLKLGRYRMTGNCIMHYWPLQSTLVSSTRTIFRSGTPVKFSFILLSVPVAVIWLPPLFRIQLDQRIDTHYADTRLHCTLQLPNLAYAGF